MNGTLPSAFLLAALALGCPSPETDKKTTDTAEADTDTDTDTDTGTSDEGGLIHGFFAIHLDPGSDAGDGGVPSADRPMEYLGSLTALVEAADVYDHKLTLMFTAQWAHHVASAGCLVPLHDTLPPGTYAYQDEVHESCLSLIQGFEAFGHEIGLHHHPTTARASWDGFSNDPGDTGEDEYLGTMDDLLNYVAAVPAGGAATITAGTTEEYPESSHSLQYMSARGPTEYVDADNRGDLASTPCAWDGEGTDVWRFRMRSLSSEAIDELRLAHGDLAHGATTYTAGFVTHAKDAADPAPVPYEALFVELHGLGITLQGLSAVAGHYSYTSDGPAADIEHACPPDEALEP